MKKEDIADRIRAGNRTAAQRHLLDTCGQMRSLVEQIEQFVRNNQRVPSGTSTTTESLFTQLGAWNTICETDELIGASREPLPNESEVDQRLELLGLLCSLSRDMPVADHTLHGLSRMKTSKKILKDLVEYGYVWLLRPSYATGPMRVYPSPAGWWLSSVNNKDFFIQDEKSRWVPVVTDAILDLLPRVPLWTPEKAVTEFGQQAVEQAVDLGLLDCTSSPGMYLTPSGQRVVAQRQHGPFSRQVRDIPMKSPYVYETLRGTLAAFMNACRSRHAGLTNAKYESFLANEDARHTLMKVAHTFRLAKTTLSTKDIMKYSVRLTPRGHRLARDCAYEQLVAASD